MTTAVDVAVIGGGIVGLSCAWRLAGQGLSVAVVDPAPGSGASHVAAGMLAPVTEVHHGEERLLALALEGARRWPGFAARLEAETGIDVGYRRGGILAVAFDDDDLRSLEELRGFQASLGLSVTRLDRRACRRREPWLSPRVRGGSLAEDDHQVDPRRVLEALLAAARTAGVLLVAEPAVSVILSGDRVVGVATPTRRVAAATVVVAAGAWSRGVEGIPASALPPVRPVKGQILRLRFDPRDPPLRGVVRGLAAGRAVYLVPRDSGELVVGATVEELGFDTTTTAGAVHDLLHAAADLVPGVAELELVEAAAGLRPGTPDNAPLLGPGPLDGLLLATGHHRNGVLLAPITAAAIVGAVTTGAVPAFAAGFAPGRFSPCTSS